MKKPHKHAELIKAWADGAKIQIHMAIGWLDCDCPTWIEGVEYRIRPETKPDYVEFIMQSVSGWRTYDHPQKGHTGLYHNQIQIVRDGETNKIKWAGLL